MEAPIGIIDSGVGGLTVAKEVLLRLPNERVIYIGDAARCPYGPRTAEEVLQFTMEMASALVKMGVKMIVIACNTATAVALDEIRRAFPLPIIGVIEPGARAAVQASVSGEVAVLGTIGTINSKAYDNAIHKLASEAVVHPLACPEFVPIVESGMYHSTEAGVIVSERLNDLKDEVFDTAILGCTHYPLLQHHIHASLPNGVKIISSAVETVHDIHRILIDRTIRSEKVDNALPIFYTTGEIEGFKEIVSDWLAIENPEVRHIQL